MTRKPAVEVRHNKDLSISIRYRGRVVSKITASAFQGDSVDAFLSGWFDTDDKRQWRVRRTFSK